MADPSDVEPIAIIGMGCRLPGNVGSAEDLWKLVSSGGSGWKLVPSDRWTRDAFYHPDKASRQAYNAVSGYFLDQDISHYDSRFFGFSSAEANMTDPQQRILLETAYEALENAGIPMESLKGSDTAVFAALFARDYDRMGYKDLDTLSGLHIGGAGEAIIANRISHFFDLRGTSMTIDTGCSGSLVALHEACICLRAGQSRMAIVGGTEILLHPDQNISMSTAGMLNDDGKSYTFDSRGSGYGRGEGVAAVVVKRLRDALEDGDTIHSVIRISGSNQDGKTNGVTLPSPEAQEALMRQVYRNAGLDPHETLYVEAHGTGTVAGDHAEAKSLSRVFCEKKRRRNLWVGSVKTNMGHLEAASGLAGLIKAVMVIKNQQIPPNLNYIEPKPGLMLDERQLQVPLELLPLIPEGEKGAVRVSVNSFGYGGTNCHIILESLEQFKTSGSRYLPTSNGFNGHKANGVNGVNGVNGTNGTNGHHATNGTNGVHTSNGVNGTNGTNGHVTEDTAETKKLPLVFPMSASSEATLEAMPGLISEWLGSREVSDSDLRQLSYTLSCRRSLLKWRKTFVAPDLEKLQASLDEKVIKTRSAPSAKIAFVFTGQGAQWAGMGRDLVSSSETFRKSIEASSRILKDLGCEWDLLEELSKPAKESRINESELAQPLTTIVQMALVDLLADMDIKPQFVVGHSSGEIAASYAAGALSHENAIKGSFFRGRYSKVAKKLNPLPGSMMATGYSEQAALQSIKAANIGPEKGRVVVACVNSPESVTLSGDEPAIDMIQDMISNVGIFARKLVVESAYHSHHMEKVADAYSESIGDLASSDVKDGVEFMSSVTGSAKTNGFGSDYWVKNLVSQVRFNDAVNALALRMSETGATDAANIFIEIGPHAALQGPLKQILGGIPGFKHSYVAPLLRGKSSSDTFMTAAGRLFELGAEVSWQSLFSAKDKRVVEDLRPYPWDHRVQHWSESRLSRDHRLRQFPYHDLLGLFDVMSPVDEPRWRFYVSVDRMPWIKDHVVDGMVIFPGAGYSAMGIEALKQLTKMQNPDAKITKTIFRNIRNFRPIVLPDEAADGTTKDIELMLMLSPSKMNDNAPWYSVRVLSLQPDGTWADHVSGTIRVELEGESGNVNNFGEEHKAAIEEAHEALERVTATAQEKMNMDTFYDERRAAGNDWGPGFALLTEGYIGKGCGLAKMKIPDIAECMPMGYFEPHLIHPTTLDASNHMLPAIFHREVINSPLMPFTTDESIFTNHLSSKPGDEMVIATELVPDGKTAARCNAWAFQPDESGQLRLVSSVRGLVLRAVGEDLDKNQIKPFDRKHNYQVFWNDDTDFLTQERYTELVDPFVARGPEVLDKLSTDEKAAAIYLQSVKDHSVIKDPDAAKLPHLSKYGRWISDYINSETCQGLIGALSAAEQESILEQSANSGIEGEGLACIGRNLKAILDDETSPLELLVADNILERIYADGPAKPLLNQMVEYVKLLVNKDPQMDILEVGAGTGSATKPFFAALGDDASDQIHKYHYTDISTSFFDTAKEHLEKWSSLVEYKTLDISKDPVEQGFDPKQQQYDVVIASNVLHATKSINETLANVRMLLKPGGRLLLIEMERVETRILPTIFGTLPGWWEFNDGRKDSALLTNEEWDSELKAASFGGIEYVSPNCEKSRISLIIAKAVQEEPIDAFTPPSAVKVISSSASPIGVAAGQALSSTFEKNGVPSSALTWDSFSTLEEEDASTLHIVLDSANSTILSRPDNEIFTRMQSVLVKSQSILWIMFHEEDKPELNPIKALINGLARTLRREAEVIKMITLEVKDLVTQEAIEGLVQNAVRVSQLLLTSEREHKPTDDEELVLESGKVLIPRAHADKQFNDWTDRVNGRSPLAPHPFNDPNLPLRMEVGAPGLLSSIHFVQDEAPFIPLAPEEIRIDSKAFGVNFRDVFTALGQMGSSSLYMGECAGVVTEVGTGDFVQKTYKVGDRVMGIFASPFASKGTMSGYDCHVLPDNVSFNEGASILIIYSTVYYSFVNIARLEPGQSILIHAGSGGVGQAAIQLARHIGCNDEGIFVTVGSEEKKAFVMREYGIPESHVLSSRSSPMDLKRKLMRMTHDRGVDVVLNSTSGEMLSESWECVAPFGFHIELGKSDIERKRHISMGPFSRNVTFSSLDMTIVSKQRPKIFYDVLDKTMALFAQGILKPVRPLNVFPIDKLEASFRLISERKHLGKVVLDLGDENTKVQAVLPPPPALKLRKDGSYIIAGGLGDIGRMLMKHLATLGAGHIITLSRRRLPDEERIALEDEVKALGGQLHLEQCDITNNESVEKLAQKCKESYPPVRGLVHAGMILKDRPFVKMSSDEWNTVLGPKVFGTWHLDAAFKSPDLDFFITLSSISGAVGNPGQSNYGAANAFQDAFVASHDRTHGTRYVSLDLPIVGATKAVTNLQSQNHDFQHKGGIVFNIDEIPQLMEYAMDSSIDLGRPFWHALMGFDRQSIAQGSGDYIWTAVYRTIPQLQASDAEVGSGGVKRDVEAMIRNAESFEDAVQIIAEMTHEKFIAFLNLDAEDVNMDQPLSSFGLDSLVSIELKNWMVRTFKVTLQAAELSNAPSMLHLAELLASRSKILPSTLAKRGQAADGKEDEPIEAKGGFQDASAAEKVEATNGTSSEVAQRLECCPDPAHPLIQPVPSLKEAMNDMFDSFVAMAETEEEIENFRTAVNEFVVSGGTAEKLHAETEALAASVPQGNWIREWLCNNSYLSMRQPIQYTSFMAVNHPSATPHSQAERAALIILEAYKFKREIDEDRVGPLFLADTPICKAPLQYLFNTYRRPAIGKDVILKASEDYCVVLRRGRLFVIPLQDVDFESLRATLSSIITHVGEDQGIWAGILTTDNRDSWAQRREELLALNPGNAKYLQTIEQAAFTVNLDDGSPVGYTEHAKHGMLSSGFNRWFDKGVQLLIAENGNSGMIIEHSHIDGTTPETVYARLSEVIPAYKPTPLTTEAPVPEELSLVTSPEIELHIAVLRERFADASAVRDYTSHILPTFTPHVLGAGGVSFKAGYDMLVQLALYFYWDHRILPNWAPIMHLHFHEGRHDVVQMMSPAVRAFCEAIKASPRGENNSKKRALLLEAVKDINARVRKTRDGKGWLRTFAAIQRAWPKDEPAALWNDELWLRGFDFRAMSNINHPTTEAISTPLDASTLRLRYTIQDTQSIISLNCPVGSTDKIKRCVDEAAAIIEELCAVR